MNSIFNKFFGDPNEKELKKIQPLVDQINSLNEKVKKFSDSDIKKRIKELKQELIDGKTLDSVLVEVFALVREISDRTLNQRHFNSQLIGGIVLHQGNITQMLTGEGKTLASTLPISLNALEGKGVHVITVNDYLARRDTVWMGQIYDFLGLSVGCLNHNQSFLYDASFKKADEDKDETRDELGGFKVVEDFLRPCNRSEAYLADITYGTNNEFGFDYLRDNMVYDLKKKAQREFNFAIIDEVDSILIDEARTPLIISAPDVEATRMYKEFSRIIPMLQSKSDYEVDEKMKTVTLTEKGVDKVEKILGMKDIYQGRGIKYLHHLEQGLRAQAINPSTGRPFFEKDHQYIVKQGKVIIIDESTGRLMPGRRWSGGLHQAIEAKEKVEVKPESKTLASITFQNYFRLYEKLAGMTGTAISSAEEFDKVYSLEVIVIPTNKPMQRKSFSDKIYKTENGKFKAIIKEIKERHEKKQPVLIGTRSVERNEYLGKLLDREGISHQILNAKHHEKEGEIIAQAGRLGAVTVATNMAGRGVDIILGGNPLDPEQANNVKELGGLHVIGTERHEARRIDNQLRGRAGRQGDPGSSQFFVSLEDDLMRIFGGDRINKIMERLNMPEDQPIEVGLISGIIQSAQAKIEGVNFDSRKHLLDYDDVMNKQRTVIYTKRKEILEKSEEDSRAYILELLKKSDVSEEDYKKKEQEIGKDKIRKVEKFLCLKILDSLWIEHLDDMNHLMDSVRLRAYGQRDPLVEYKGEGHRMFLGLVKRIEELIAKNIIKIELVPESAKKQQGEVLSNKKFEKKVGRNDPCPCGKIDSETNKPKKYKKCCWPKYSN